MYRMPLECFTEMRTINFRRNDPPLCVITQESMTLEEIGKALYNSTDGT